ncbi:hypothetical protein [Aeromicrobium sp. Leaf291]|uniref:TY-Chap domain-containing protein n=1 Tax=Aeromicrobium sp. Leaf291 TaxID=1736325 RepID=UPI0006F2AA4A|nr:hypothetical protein [Aeromicrobium sp. Leaf291]KQP82165.1 hypothetical protein ASF35_12025 [Aeromicrobium sp. Leaf291]
MTTGRSAAIPWASFAASLADMARRLPADGSFILHRDEGERDDFDLPRTPKYVQVCRWDAAMLRCEVVSNTYLPEGHHWTASEEHLLVAMGWLRPDPDDPTASPNWCLDVEMVWAEAGVDRIVRVLRDLWGARVMSDVVLDAEDLRQFRWIDTPEDLDDDPGR